MYLPFFGLAEKPFSITPDPRYLFLSGRHAEALTLIERALAMTSPFTATMRETRATIVERMGKPSP